MLKLGTQSIAALHLGGEQIPKAYLGEAVVFGTGAGPGQSRLPEGYTEVEYIESSGGARIDTLQKPATTLKVAMDVEPLSENQSSESQHFLAAPSVSNGNYTYTAYVVWLKGVHGGIGRWSSAGSGPIYTTDKIITNDGTPRRMRIEVNWPNKTIAVNEDSASYTTNNVYSTFQNLCLLSISKTATSGLLDARLYSCQMYISDEAIRNFVPCTDPTGAVGLYDLVEGKFYGNAGTGAFIAGPVV